MHYVKTKIASKELGVSADTLRRWDREGKINVRRVGASGTRLYDIKEFLDRPQETHKRNVLYCRVSSSKQKEDLERQIQYLKNKYPDYEVVKEIASGINFKRKGLQALIDSCIQGDVREIVVAHKDRLCRIAFDHFKWLLDRLGVNLIVDGEEIHSPESELADELISIIHVFSCRHYGARRKYTTKGGIESQG